MESVQLLLNGFATALQPSNLIFAVIGSLLGTLVGVLPGLGSTATIAMLIPLTFVLESTPAIIMLCAIWYGAAYGGTITSVLINVPGEGSTAVTCIEGHAMARQGRAGAALSIAAIGSFIGGTVSIWGLVLVALPLTRAALAFGPPEFFALIVLGLTMVSGLAGRSLLRAGVSALLGLFIGMVGLDPVIGGTRFTFDQPDLLDGFGITPVVMGMFGIAQILQNAEESIRSEIFGKVGSLWVTRKDFMVALPAILRGIPIGFFLGLIPGLGASVSSFMSYIAEKKFSRTPEKFGTEAGMIEGVAGPETANNADVQAHMIPLFTLGLPTTATAAVFMGALMIYGLTPGPLLFRDHPDFVWAIIASMYVGNLVLLVLNMPLIPMWMAVLRIPYSILFGLILLFCVVGAYSLKRSIFDVGAMAGFGVLGYAFKKLDFPLPPAILCVILGPMMERKLRESLQMSQGDFSIFFTRPISATLLVLAAIVVVAFSFRIVSRPKARVEDA